MFRVRLLLVAEQDEDGRVTCVWYWKTDMMAARPLTRREDLPEDLSAAEFSGASRDQICFWIEHRLAAAQDRAAASAWAAAD